ncbi:peptidylprolyl isomerase [Massilia sp. W12]|uniref:peptidylprolyl isomerase n=1 Tax=Massilia sp. W12 TaxID=3126507 RepID=UPI0030CE363C
MKKLQQTLRITALCAVLAASTGGAPAALAAGKSETVDSIALVVNDEVITRRELEIRLNAVVERLKKQRVELPSQADLMRQLAERMITERAQLQLAKEYGMRVDDIMLDRAIARIAEGNKMNLQQFRNQLEKDGIPFASFREEIRDEIVISRLREREVESKLIISDSEVENYLAEQSQQTQTAQEFNLAHILVRLPENASPEQIAQRRARAEDVMRQLRLGADFGKTAAAYSDSPEGLRGGEIGWRNPDRLPQLFVDAIAELKDGQITQILRSPNGFHILKVLGKRSLNQASAAIPTQSQQTRARHILIKVTPAMPLPEARKKIAELRDKLVNKTAKFEDLARQFSGDGSAAKGGDLGWLYPGDTLPEFEGAMNKLKLGEVSEAVETSYGLHLIEVLERKSDDVSKERQKQVARAALRERKMEEAVEDWARQVRDRAYVEYRIEELKQSDGKK